MLLKASVACSESECCGYKTSVPVVSGVVEASVACPSFRPGSNTRTEKQKQADHKREKERDMKHVLPVHLPPFPNP